MKIINFLSGIVILSAFVVVGVFGYWAIYPYQLLEITNSPMPTDKNSYVPGEIMTYYAEYCKYTNQSVTITRSFVDGVKYDMPEVRANNPSGCNNLYPAIVIPNLPTGAYSLVILYTYQINPLRLVSYSAYTQDFMVINERN